MGTIEDLPEHIKDTIERRGAAPAAGIFLFGLLLLFCSLPVVGPFITEKTFADLHDAENDVGDGGGDHH